MACVGDQWFDLTSLLPRFWGNPRTIHIEAVWVDGLCWEPMDYLTLASFVVFGPSRWQSTWGQCWVDGLCWEPMV